MMIYLTGANASLAKSAENPQTDPNNSLGGYISSSPVPNSAVNSLFDLLSSLTLQRRNKETIAIGLINKFDFPVKDVCLKVISGDENIAEFKVAAINVDKSNYCMERIGNRYQEPMQADFYNADFYRAAVDVTIINPAQAGEEIVLYPFDIDVSVTTSGIEGTWDAIYRAFKNNNTYSVKRLTETKFRIERKDEEVITVPLECSFITTELFNISFEDKFKNKLDNSVSLIAGDEELAPGEAIGIWLQRSIKSERYKTDEELIQDYDNKVINSNLEEIELILSYNNVNNV